MKLDLNDILSTLRNEEDYLSINTSEEMQTNDISPSFFKETESELTVIKQEKSILETQMDMDTLNKYRRNKKTSADIINSSLLKFTDDFVFLIKSVKKFSEEITLIELMDENGVLEGSILKELESRVMVGWVIRINGFSVWRINKPHINIVEENIDEIIK